MNSIFKIITIRLELKVRKFKKSEVVVPAPVSPRRGLRLGLDMLLKNSKLRIQKTRLPRKIELLYRFLDEIWDTFHGKSLTCKDVLDFTTKVLDNSENYRSSQLFPVKFERRLNFFDKERRFKIINVDINKKNFKANRFNSNLQKLRFKKVKAFTFLKRNFCKLLLKRLALKFFLLKFINLKKKIKFIQGFKLLKIKINLKIKYLIFKLILIKKRLLIVKSAFFCKIKLKLIQLLLKKKLNYKKKIIKISKKKDFLNLSFSKLKKLNLNYYQLLNLIKIKKSLFKIKKLNIFFKKYLIFKLNKSICFLKKKIYFFLKFDKNKFIHKLNLKEFVRNKQLLKIRFFFLWKIFKKFSKLKLNKFFYNIFFRILDYIFLISRIQIKNYNFITKNLYKFLVINILNFFKLLKDNKAFTFLKKYTQKKRLFLKHSFFFFYKFVKFIKKEKTNISLLKLNKYLKLNFKQEYTSKFSIILDKVYFFLLQYLFNFKQNFYFLKDKSNLNLLKFLFKLKFSIENFNLNKNFNNKYLLKNKNYLNNSNTNFSRLLKSVYFNNILLNKNFFKCVKKNSFKLIVVNFLSFFNSLKFFGRKIKKKIYLIKLRSFKNNKFFNRIFYSLKNKNIKRNFDKISFINKFIKFLRSSIFVEFNFLIKNFSKCNNKNFISKRLVLLKNFLRVFSKINFLLSNKFYKLRRSFRFNKQVKNRYKFFLFNLKKNVFKYDFFDRSDFKFKSRFLKYKKLNDTKTL